MGKGVLAAFVVALCVIGVEFYARREGRFLLMSLHLEKYQYWDHASAMMWNEEFVRKQPEYFREWPVPLVTFKGTSAHPRHRYLPNQNLIFQGRSVAPGEKPFWSTNEMGFRGGKISQPKRGIRIVCLGDSATEGATSDEEHTYPAVLQQILRNRFPEIPLEVINAGSSGVSFEDLLEELRQTVYPLKPDLVIFYAPSTLGNLSDFATLSREVPEKPEWFRSLRMRSAAFRLLVATRPSAGNSLQSLNLEIESPAWKKVFNSFRRLGIDAARNGVKLVLPEILHSDEAEAFPFSKVNVSEIYSTLNKVMQKAMWKTDSKIIPGTDKSPRASHFYNDGDYIHLNDEGHQAFATVIADSLELEIKKLVMVKIGHEKKKHAQPGRNKEDA